jgi:phospholipase C
MALRTTAKLLSSVSSVGTLSIASALLGTASAIPAHAEDGNLSRIGHIIVIYQENWSFDSLYGQFPGAENGGRWDHVPPPVRSDGWGVGVRVPTIVVSPLARRGAVDSHEMETVSILKLIERRFHLAPLGTRDADPKIGDLSSVLAD